jgi:hypothetical protein
MNFWMLIFYGSKIATIFFALRSFFPIQSKLSFSLMQGNLLNLFGESNLNVFLSKLLAIGL